MMNLKPVYNTGTITFIESPEKITLRKIDSSYVRDPEGVIPNGIYKVFKHERNQQKFLVLFSAVLLLGFGIHIALMSTVLLGKVNYFWFVPSIIGFCLSTWKFVSVLLDMKHLTQSIAMYRESLIAGSRLTPPFISNLYIGLYKSQARQNWTVAAILFYGTLATLVFWWLKDVNWWIFTFKDWIKDLTKNPELVGFLMISVLVVTLILHIYFTVYRKKRTIDIESFFGNEVISKVEIDEILRQKNKLYGRIFFISILVVLVLPFIGWIIYKKVLKK